jgi:rod shape determining protein RodA
MKNSSGQISAPLPLPEARPRLEHLATIRWGLLAAALALSCVGLATVHSASAELGTDYFSRQLVWVGIGLVAMVVAFSFNYHTLLGFSLPLYLLALVTLALVLVLGYEAGGAQGWFRLGSVGVQPSEFAKLVTALYLARYLAAPSTRQLPLRQIFAAVALVALPMLLIVFEPDLGGAAMFVPMAAGMLLVSGVRLRILLTTFAACVVAGLLIWSLGMKPYQRQRVLTFLAPDTDPLGAGYQVRQSKIAVGSGEVAGRGYGQGTQSQLRFLPARHTDFILSVLAEEWGFVGVGTVLLLYAAYLYNVAAIAMRAQDRAGILLVVGLGSTFAFHVLYNSAMVIGLVPVTGIPLPFLSYGGSFTLLNFIGLGLILGVDYRRFANR